MKFQEKVYTNKMVLIGHVSIAVVLMLAYLIEVWKGTKTLPYVLLTEAVLVIPLIAELICYRINKEGNAIKYILGVGYSLFYMLAIFTSDASVTWVYVLPMYIVITLFSDVLYCCVLCVAAFLINTVQIVYHWATIGYSVEALAAVEIRLACMLLCGIFLVIATMAMKRINGEKMNRIQKQKDKTNAMLEEVLVTSESMIRGIADASKNVAQLGESVAHIHSSMQEVTAGSTETAESVQHQMQRTEQIQSHIVKAKNTADEIDKSMAQTTAQVEQGQKYMDNLTAQVEKSMSANNRVVEKMQELQEYTTRMNDIIETITSIAGQTGMLALNASIEAARAGEAGRGFAVVAGQISNLASQTKSATVDITAMIEGIQSELTEVTQAVDVVTESNRSNTESTKQVEESFRKIAEDTYNVGRQTDNMKEIVGQLEIANGEIVESIQTISAITEEVSAHANETYDACEENTIMVNNVNEIVMQLNSEAGKLKQYH